MLQVVASDVLRRFGVYEKLTEFIRQLPGIKRTHEHTNTRQEHTRTHENTRTRIQNTHNTQNTQETHKSIKH